MLKGNIAKLISINQTLETNLQFNCQYEIITCMLPFVLCSEFSEAHVTLEPQIYDSQVIVTCGYRQDKVSGCKTKSK